jgi:hypothetical protein
MMGELGLRHDVVSPEYGGGGMDNQLRNCDGRKRFSPRDYVGNSLVCWGLETFGTEEQ